MVYIIIEYEYYTSIITILFIRSIAQQKRLIIGCLTFLPHLLLSKQILFNPLGDSELSMSAVQKSQSCCVKKFTKCYTWVKSYFTSDYI